MTAGAIVKRDPYASLKVGASLIVAGIFTVGAAFLPFHSDQATKITKALKIAGHTITLAITGKVFLDLVRYENMQLQIDGAEAIREQVILNLIDAENSYYSHRPRDWNEGKPVPDDFYRLYAQTGGNPEVLASYMVANSPIAIATPSNETPSEALNIWSVHSDPDAPIEYIDDSNILAMTKKQNDSSWVTNLLRYPSILIYGAFGSGKTTFAYHLVKHRLALGHQVFALDPHYEAGAWPGTEVIGAGMYYDEIDFFIDNLAKLVQSRYQTRKEQKNAAFRPITICCEELTRWSTKTQRAPELIGMIPDYRKIGVHLLMVSHGRTLGSLGGKEGYRDVLDAALLELQLLTKATPDGGAEPLMEGYLKLPSCQKVLVSIPDLAVSGTQVDETTTETAETATEQGLQPPASDGFKFLETPETPVKADDDPAEKVRQQFFELKDIGLTKTQIIQILWKVQPGGTKKYDMASKFYDRLLAEYELAHSSK